MFPSPDSSGNPFYPRFLAGKKIVANSWIKLQIEVVVFLLFELPYFFLRTIVQGFLMQLALLAMYSSQFLGEWILPNWSQAAAV